MPLAVKLVGFLLIAGLVANVVFVAWLGRGARTRDPHVIAAHRKSVGLLLMLLIFMVFSIEGFVRFYGSGEYPWYFWWIHLPADTMCVVLFGAMWLRYDGDRRRDIHRYIAYPAIASSAVMVVTGSMLFYSA
jgi:hypothetical protein